MRLFPTLSLLCLTPIIFAARANSQNVNLRVGPGSYSE